MYAGTFYLLNSYGVDLIGNILPAAILNPGNVTTMFLYL